MIDVTRGAATLLIAVLSTALAGCGRGDADDAAAGACLAGAEDCADVPTGSGGPLSGEDGSLWLSDAVDAGVQGPFLVAAHYVDDGTQRRLCSALLESFPPQCGGPSLALAGPDDAVEAAVTAWRDSGALTSQAAVTWSSDPIAIEGEIDGATFVVR